MSDSFSFVGLFSIHTSNICHVASLVDISFKVFLARCFWWWVLYHIDWFVLYINYWECCFLQDYFWLDIFFIVFIYYFCIARYVCFLFYYSILNYRLNKYFMNFVLFISANLVFFLSLILYIIILIFYLFYSLIVFY